MSKETPISDDSLFANLEALAESAFPKKCNTCGKVYNCAEDFIINTVHVRQDHSGLKPAVEEDGSTILEVFRNCHCGSTLMDAFNDRRDLSEKGEKRRQRFQELLEYLVQKHQFSNNQARDELINLMKTGKSEFLRNIKNDKKN